MNLEQQRDRFSSSPERESDSVRITPSVEFKPLALVSGRAAVGFRRVTFLAGKQPEFKSTVASVDLQYTFRGRTQFSISALRDLEYSYIDTQLDYLLAGFNTSVTQRFGDGWDVRGTVGRYRLGYRRRELLAVTQPFPRETTLNSGVNIGYYIGRHRVGFDLHHYRRRSDVAFGRGYDRLRVSTSLTYAF